MTEPRKHEEPLHEPHPRRTDTASANVPLHPSEVGSTEHWSDFEWAVALDAEGECRGALQFSRWLATNSRGQRFRGVHVPPDDGVDAIASAQRVRAVITSAHADGIFDALIQTDADLPPVDALTELSPRPSAGLILSRRADASGSALIRLGGMVRRIAEQSSTPVAIVPHDLDLMQMSHGPVVLAVDPESTPDAAAGFAAGLARSKGLRLLLVTVAQVEGFAALSSDMDEVMAAYEQAERNTHEKLLRWAADNGVAQAWREVVRGNVRFAIQTVAQRYDASIIVCGTRQRRILERLLEPSRALELARYARRPVILVPADDEAEATAPVAVPAAAGA